MKFCKAEFSTESLSFYLYVQQIRNCPLSQIKEKAEIIYRLISIEKLFFTGSTLLVD